MHLQGVLQCQSCVFVTPRLLLSDPQRHSFPLTVTLLSGHEQCMAGVDMQCPTAFIYARRAFQSQN